MKIFKSVIIGAVSFAVCRLIVINVLAYHPKADHFSIYQMGIAAACAVIVLPIAYSVTCKTYLRILISVFGSLLYAAMLSFVLGSHSNTPRDMVIAALPISQGYWLATSLLGTSLAVWVEPFIKIDTTKRPIDI
ncbi:hypothetical protein BH11ARM1_BH11ARM1_11620 [soil metagenome]